MVLKAIIQRMLVEEERKTSDIYWNREDIVKTKSTKNNIFR